MTRGGPRASSPFGVAPLPRAFAPRAVRLLAVALAALLAGARVVGLGPFEVTESRLFDALIRPLLPPAPTDPRIVIVEIDDRTLADLGERWPLERATWAQFLRRLAVYEPVAVAADVMFDLPELGNERAILDELRQQVLRSPLGGKDDGREVVGWIDGIDRRIDADQDLARAMGELGNVTLGLLCTADAGLKAHPTITTSLEHDGQGLATRAEHVMASHPALALAARASGAMNVTIDPDGTVRRYPYAIAVDGVAWPSLALAVALSDADPAARRAMMERVVAADGGTPTLRFRAQTQPWARVSLSDVMLAPHTEGLARLLRGKVIFLGATAIGIEDLQRTPVADRTAGIELHATALENLTQGSWLVTGGPAAWATLALVVVVVGGLALFLGRRPRARWIILVVVVCIAMHISLVVLLAAHANLALGLVALPLGVIALGAAEAAYRWLAVRRERHALFERERRHDAERSVLEGFRRLVEHMGDAMIAADASDRVRWMNPAAEGLFQRRITTGAEVFVGELVPKLADPALRSAGGVIEAVALVPGLDDGIPVEATAMRMATGPEVWTNFVIRDTSTRKAYERQKDSFVANVSHELRTPLTSILGSLRLVTEGVVGEIPPAAKDLLQVASQNGERLLVLVNDLLDSAKLAAGQLALERKPIALGRLIGMAAARNHGFAVRFGVRLEARPIPAELVERQLDVDVDRIIEVLGNLVSNAVKHTPEGGVVEIEVTPSERGVRITVADRGPGIRTSQHGQLFDKFSRAAPADGRRRAGTGLGLSIAKEIVELHGGRIGVDSQVGVGSRFWFELGPLLP